MSFDKGRATFMRFAVKGDAPQTVDEGLIERLAAGAFVAVKRPQPDLVEVGWVSEHMLDTRFSFEKNGFDDWGNLLRVHLRIDRHKVPAELKEAYRRINEGSAAAGNPSGFASAMQKREAKEEAERQISQDVAKGKFRRTKVIPLMWDLLASRIYFGTTSSGDVEQLTKFLGDQFGVELDLMTAGCQAERILDDLGERGDFEDLRPSRFTKPPRFAAGHMSNGGDFEQPCVPWVAKAARLTDYLGNEFAIWLWWLVETADGQTDLIRPVGATRSIAVMIDTNLHLHCAWDVAPKAAISGDGPHRSATAHRALGLGKWPRQVGLILSDGERQWAFTLHADRFSFHGMAMDAPAECQSPRELIDWRLKAVRDAADLLDGLYATFLHQRRKGWPHVRERISQWIRVRELDPEAKVPSNARRKGAA